MELQKLNVKFFVEQPQAVRLTDFIEIFHGWIQATDGLYHDVADYTHAGEGRVSSWLPTTPTSVLTRARIAGVAVQSEKPPARFDPE
jgi:hypothetical protein